MITYIEKGQALHDLIAAAGYTLAQHNGVWVSNNNVAVQAIINAFDPVPNYKAAKIATLKAEGLVRINVLFPEINSMDEITFYAEFWLSLTAVARSPTANFQKVINIHNAAKSAIASVKSATTTAQVDAVTASWPA